MRRRYLAKLLQSATLIAVLLTAQTAALAHSELADSHPANEVCALCVGLASLGAGNVSAAQHLDVVVQAAQPVDYRLVHSVTRRVQTHFARGPPQHS
jgi:hypothetical protein